MRQRRREAAAAGAAGGPAVEEAVAALSKINDIISSSYIISYLFMISYVMPAVAERLRRAYPAPLGRAGVGSIPANPRRTKRAFFPPLAI